MSDLHVFYKYATIFDDQIDNLSALVQILND